MFVIELKSFKHDDKSAFQGKMHVVISTVEENMNNNNLIIVAEDDDDIAAIPTGYLRKAGMKTLRAEDGEQGNQSYPSEQSLISCYWTSTCPCTMAGMFSPR